jgi:hypothetical protein
MIATKDYDQSTMTGNGVWFVENAGHTAGRQLLGAVLFWVPRTLWPSKPVDTGTLIGIAMQDRNVSLSGPLWLEFWIDFGYPGLIVGFAAVGYGANRLDGAFSSRIDSARRSVYASDIFMPMIAGYTFILLRGSLLQAMSRLAVIVAVCWFVGGKPVELPEDVATGQRGRIDS